MFVIQSFQSLRSLGHLILSPRHSHGCKGHAPDLVHETSMDMGHGISKGMVHHKHIIIKYQKSKNKTKQTKSSSPKIKAQVRASQDTVTRTMELPNDQHLMIMIPSSVRRSTSTRSDGNVLHFLWPSPSKRMKECENATCVFCPLISDFRPS